jgi:histidine triad (HIT) family protein
MVECVFCKIVRGEVPSTKLFEDETKMAFLDIFPAAKGHALVIPKKHFESFLEVPREELKELIVLVQDLAKKIVKAVNAEGFNVYQSNGVVAGQTINHMHFHIIPRFKGDGLPLKWKQSKPEKPELEALKNQILKEKGNLTD